MFHKLKHIFGYLLIALMSITTSYGAPTELLSLHDAIFLALRFNPEIRSAEIKRVSDKFALALAKNQFEPNYTFSANDTWNKTKIGGIENPSTNAYSATAGVSLLTPVGTQLSFNTTHPYNQATRHYNPSMTFQIIQPLMRGFGSAVVQAALQNAYDNEHINRLNLQNTIINTVTTVIANYVGFVQAKATLEVQEQALNRFQQSLTRTIEYIKAGRKPQTDAVHEEAQIAKQNASIQASKIAVNNARFILLNSLGLDPNAKIEVLGKIPFHLYRFPTAKRSEQLALYNNINYQIARISLNSLRRAFLTAKDANRWTLNLTLAQTMGQGASGGANAGMNSLLNNHNRNQTASLNLTIPIDDMSLKNQLVQTRVNLDIADINLAQTKRALQIQVHNNRDTLLNQLKTIQLDEMSFRLQQQDIQNAEKLYEAGRISSFELAQRQVDLTTAQQQWINDQMQYFIQLAAFDSQLSTTLKTWKIPVKDKIS